MAKSLWDSTPRRYAKLDSVIPRSAITYARSKVKPDFVNAVSFMSINIPFHVVVDASKDDLTVGVEVIPNVTFTRETDGEQIPAHLLFTWLDKGTSVKHIKFLGPTDTGQSNQGFADDDPRILASQKYNLPGIEAKNWTEQIAERHRKGFPVAILSTIKSFLGGK